MNGFLFLLGVAVMIPPMLIILASGRSQQPAPRLPAAMPVAVATSAAKYTGDPGVGRASFKPVVGSRYNVIDRFAWIEVQE